MTITRAHLEKAAKMAGLEVDVAISRGVWRDLGKLAILNDLGGHTTWNPMHDHGQLHDLAMACKIGIDPENNIVRWVNPTSKLHRSVSVNCQDFSALAEVVILAACEQFDAKGKGLTP